MKSTCHRQRGIALLLFLFLAIGIGATVFLSSWNTNRARIDQDRKTQLALEQAKEALIGYAAAYKDSSGFPLPGRLPCPETLSPGSPIEGQAQTSCSSVATRLGRYPWNSLKTDRLLDGSGEPLWYAVSSGFYSASINSNSVGQLQLNSTPNAVIAIIFSPGPPLPGQNRSIPSATNPPQPSNYLDLGNASGVTFISSGPTTTFNDHIITITNSELFKVVNQRVLAEIRGPNNQSPLLPSLGLRGYYNSYGQLPWADINGDGAGDTNQTVGAVPYIDLATPWLNTNNWPPLITYQRLTSSSAKISIGSTTMSIVPCTALPCP